MEARWPCCCVGSHGLFRVPVCLGNGYAPYTPSAVWLLRNCLGVLETLKVNWQRVGWKVGRGKVPLFQNSLPDWLPHLWSQPSCQLGWLHFKRVLASCDQWVTNGTCYKGKVSNAYRAF